MLRFCPLPHIAQKSIGYRSNHAATRLAGTLASASQSVCCQCSNILSVVKRRMAARAFSPSRMRNAPRSEEHTSELQSLMRISYAVFCLKQKKTNYRNNNMFTNISMHTALYHIHSQT